MARAQLQQERSRQTRRSIVEAAETLWRLNGFDAVSVEDVCKRAGVAKGTFYFYFPRKEHLLVANVFGRFFPRESELEDVLASDLNTVAALAALMGGMGGRVRKLKRGLVLRAVEESFRHFRGLEKVAGGGRTLHRIYHPVLTRGVARGEINPAWDLELAARALAWATLQEIFWWGSRQIKDAEFLPNLLERSELFASGLAAARPD